MGSTKTLTKALTKSVTGTLCNRGVDVPQDPRALGLFANTLKMFVANSRRIYIT